jgi:hypothetical protein
MGGMDLNIAQQDQDVVVSKKSAFFKWVPIAFVVFFLLLITHRVYAQTEYLDALFYLAAACAYLMIEIRIEVSSDAITQSIIFAGLSALTRTKTIAFADITLVSTLNRIYSIESNAELIFLSRDLYRNSAALTAKLQQHIPLDKFIERRPYPAFYYIDKRPKQILFFTAVLGTVTLVAAHGLLVNKHAMSDSIMDYVLLTALIVLPLTYLWVKGERKPAPVRTSLLTAIPPTIALACFLFIVNHLLSERIGTQTAAEFIYADAQYGCQSWRPVDSVAIKLHREDGSAQVCGDWEKGYTPALTLGATYRINIVRGFFNDISFPVDAFKHAVLTKAAPPTAPLIAPTKLLDPLTR